MDLPVDHGVDLIRKAREKSRDERIWMQWAIQLPYMGQDNYVSYTDYRDRLTGANIDLRTTAEILHEVEEIERQFAAEEG